jgi:hypothetical protein
MNLYLVRGDIDFGCLCSMDNAPWPSKGGVLVQSWTEPILTMCDDVEFLPLDCMAMNTGSDGLILSSLARDTLQDILSPAGQFLPVRVLNYNYWWFNCVACVTGLDSERTDAEWEEVKGNWGTFRWISAPRTLEFHVDVVATAPSMFRVPEFPYGTLFGNEILKQAIANQNLTGFRMDRVWSKDHGGMTNPPGFDFSEAVRDLTTITTVSHKRAEVRAILRQRSAHMGSRTPGC